MQFADPPEALVSAAQSVRSAPLSVFWPVEAKRFLSRPEAAAYLGVSASTFAEEVLSGMWPAPTRRGRTGRALTWDKAALDRAADCVSGIAPTASPAGVDHVARAEAAILERLRGSP